MRSAGFGGRCGYVVSPIYMVRWHAVGWVGLVHGSERGSDRRLRRKRSVRGLLGQAARWPRRDCRARWVGRCGSVAGAGVWLSWMGGGWACIGRAGGVGSRVGGCSWFWGVGAGRAVGGGGGSWLMGVGGVLAYA